MKNLIIILLLCVATINAQDFVHTHFVKGDSPYLTDSVMDAKYKVIEKFTKTFEDPLDDYFWPKTPGELWDTNVRYYIITINDNKKYDLFVLNEYAYNEMRTNLPFQFVRFPIYSKAMFYNLIQRDSREEILEMLK